MGEIVTLTDDIDGPSVTADERVKFSVDGRDYEIDLTTEHADKLRGLFASLTETVRVRAGIDGQAVELNLPTAQAEEFRKSAEYWTDHARKAGAPAKRVKQGGAVAPTMPVVKVGERYWETPSTVSYASKDGAAWKDLRREIKAWGEEHGYPTGQRGVIPDALGLAFAQMKHGKAWVPGPGAADDTAADVSADAPPDEDALMPEPKRTTTTTTKRTTRKSK